MPGKEICSLKSDVLILLLCIKPNEFIMNDTPIAAHGSIVNTSSGKYNGIIYYEDLEDVSHKRYHLSCAVDNNRLKILFIQPESSTTKAIFQCEFTEKNRQFDGIIQFS